MNVILAYAAVMRLAGLALIATMALPAPVSSQGLNGRYVCSLSGMWGCGGPPNGICVDRAATDRERKANTVRVDFDAKRISLNGLQGSLEEAATPAEYWVRWSVPGLGDTTLTTAMAAKQLTVQFVHSNERGGKSIGVFRCA